MKVTKLAATTAALMFMSGAAHSADLFTPEPAPVYSGGWYASIFGGANWLDDTSFCLDTSVCLEVANKYDTGFVVGGAVGHDMGSALGPLGIRLEAELSYRDNDVKSHTVVGNGQVLTGPFGSTSALAGMGNILFDLNTDSPFTIYGGGGLGVAKVDFDNHGGGLNAPPVTVMNDSDTVFAWQAIAGAGYEISPGWVFDVQYRYFNAAGVSLTAVNGASASTDYKSHAVLGGIRFKF